jgi:hypothetical protein
VPNPSYFKYVFAHEGRFKRPLRSHVRCLATHRTAQSALESAFMGKNVFKITRICAGISFNAEEEDGETAQQK